MDLRELMEDELVTARPGASIAEISRLLEGQRVGSALLVDEDTFAGILTERDIVRAVADGVNLETTPAEDYMSRTVTTIAVEEPVAVAAQLMTSLSIRHLPVVENGQLVGVLSIRDLVRWSVRELAPDEGTHLSQLADLV
jgi:CBS domain-containing protein